jgi:hypothetical protein
MSGFANLLPLRLGGFARDHFLPRDHHAIRVFASNWLFSLYPFGWSLCWQTK